VTNKTMTNDAKTTPFQSIQERYGSVARGESAGCCAPSCCSPGVAEAPLNAEANSRALGYGDDDFGAAPEGANLGLGCGNPQALAALTKGEAVLDLGSGGGFDCFLAAQQVGPTGHVIGVDMTPDMISLARRNAAAANADNVEFRLGEIEHLPVADASVDVILSNCVINLSSDKPTVFAEAFRALRQGGRLAIADVVAHRELPEDVKADVEMLSGCVSGAATADQVRGMLGRAGFVDVSIEVLASSAQIMDGWSDERQLSEWIASARIEARKP
jgi:ubiquinone/menaquinone biosynthesis C-methylase UbiE